MVLHFSTFIQLGNKNFKKHGPRHRVISTSIATTIGEKEGMEVFDNEIDEKYVGDQVKETEYNPNRITCRNAK